LKLFFEELFMKAKAQALKAQAQRWARDGESPRKISMMIANAVIDEITSFRQKNTDYLTKQLDNIKTLRDTMVARATYIDPQVTQRASLKYGAMGSADLKKVRPANYGEALVLAKELRGRDLGKDADRVYGAAERFASAYIFDRDFQTILGDAMSRETSVVISTMIPSVPLDQITAQALKQGKVGFTPIEDFIKEACGGDRDLIGPAMSRINSEISDQRIPQSLADEYYELGQLRIKMPATIGDMMTGWSEEDKAEFLKGLPPDMVKAHEKPALPAPPADTVQTDPAHEGAMMDIAKGIIDGERQRLTKEIAAVKGDNS
jgi:hypothetical protein